MCNSPDLLCQAKISNGGSLGVNYGRTTINLPSAVKVVKLLKSQGFERVTIFDCDPAVLRALAGTGIKVTVHFPNELLRSAATRSSFAVTWVLRNVAAYYPHTQIEAIAVGNEVFVHPATSTKYLLPAMENLQAALLKFSLDSAIKISSPIPLSALKSSYPPSSGSFRSELVESVLKPVLQFLRKTQSHLMVNAYPFLSYEANSDVISLDYALFRPNPGQVDPGNGLRYYSLFDAQIDAVFAAMSALKFDDVPITVTETGWPSKGDPNESGASLENAATYNGNLVRRVLTGGGTPLRPSANLTVLLYALFNEDMKPGPTSERNYGLFYPSEKKVYDIPFTREGLDSGPPEKNKNSAPASGGGVSAAGTAPAPPGQTWCVADGKAGKEKLEAALEYACKQETADCRRIQPGATCYDPNTLEAHASYAFNSYYQNSKRAVGSCDFDGAACVVTQPPRYGNCEFPADNNNNHNTNNNNNNNYYNYDDDNDNNDDNNNGNDSHSHNDDNDNDDYNNNNDNDNANDNDDHNNNDNNDSNNDKENDNDNDDDSHNNNDNDDDNNNDNSND